MSAMRPFTLVLLVAHSAAAFNTTDHVGFVPQPNKGRGTIGLLWQCLSTIFLCVSTALHLDVSIAANTSWKKLKRKSHWVSLALLMPEWICLTAMAEYQYARHTVRYSGTLDSGRKLNMRQAFFLLSGGLCLRETVDDTIWILDHEQFARCLDITHRPVGNELVNWILDNVPSVGVIDDKSKLDTVAKCIAASQAIWLAAQIIGRLASNLPISLLEVATVSYIFLTLITYLLWLKKPYGVDLPLEVTVPEVFRSDLKKVALPKSDSDVVISEVLHRVGSFPATKNTVRVFMGIFVGFLVPVFAGIHCAAWLYSYPSVAEAIIWRTCAVSQCILIWLMLFRVWLGNRDRSKLETWLNRAVLMCGYLYIVVRLFLLVECFISLRSAPPGIHESLSWPSYWGHIGS